MVAEPLVPGLVEAGPVEPREVVTEAPAVTVGNSADLACATRARAPRNWASACASVWLETATCSSSAFNWGSPKTSHHLPRRAASRGCAGFQSPGATPGGGCSLKAAGTSTGGVL